MIVSVLNINIASRESKDWKRKTKFLIVIEQICDEKCQDAKRSNCQGMWWTQSERH